ncbi:MAG: DUF4123 domain-containing protein [Planctomycetes bacterium]|nr:DUF4123 domain-containing protein [Planctomycetota bacterium]
MNGAGAAATDLPADELVRAARAGELVAVLDQLGRPAVQDWLGRAFGRTVRPLLGEHEDSADPYTAPRLVRVDDRDLEPVATLLAAEPCGVLLRSAAPLDDVATQLARWLAVELPGGEVALFRYFDPRVLRTFMAASRADERARFLGLADWIAVPAGGRWRGWRCAAPALPARASDRRLPVLQPHQVDAFAAVEPALLVEQVLTAVVAGDPALVESAGPGLLRRLVAGGIERARGHGLESVEDLAGFVAIQFEISPRFDDHPAIRAVLRDRRIAPDQRLERALKLPEEVWEQAEQRSAADPDAAVEGDDA